jgi:hypothetical protein
MKRLHKIAAFSTVLLAAAAWATDAEPSGFQSDLDSGDIINGLHKTQAVAAARAEWRCKPDNTSCSKRSGTIYFSKQFKVNGGSNISLAQFLNIKGSGTTGDSEPISQITVDQQSNGSYRVSIEQGDYPCSFRVTKGQWYTLEAGIDKGGVGWFKVDNQFCQRPAGDPARSAGSPQDDKFTGVNTYYFKYGAYNAAKNNVASSVSWR